MAITAASTTALALLDAGKRPMPIHSIYSASVNLRCGDHLINANTELRGGVTSLCMTAKDIELLCAQRAWKWTGSALVGVGRPVVIHMDEVVTRYATAPPPPPLLSGSTAGRLRVARARAGRLSWFDAGPGLDVGLPRVRNAIRALVRREPAAADRLCEIVGLGAGLTPSADDAIVGALCLVWAHRGVLPSGVGERIAVWLRTEGAAATTAVSLSHLRLAIDGAFSSPVTRVVGCLTEGSSQVSLEESVRVLSEHGATSGMDTALGIQLACEFLTSSSSNVNRSGQSDANR